MVGCLLRFIIVLLLSAGAYGNTRDLLIHGCWKMQGNDRCYYRPNTTLRFWASEKSSLALAGKAAQVEPAGTGFSFRFQPKESHVVLMFPVGAEKRKITLIAEKTPSWLSELKRRLIAGKADLAKQLLRQVITDDDKSAEAYSRLALLVLGEGDNKAATRLLNTAAKLYQEKENWPSYVNDVTVLLYLALYRDEVAQNSLSDKAKELFEKLDEMSSPLAKTHYLLSYYRGIYYRYEGHYQLAQRELQRAVDVADNFQFVRELGMAREALANLLTEVGQFAHADRVYQRLLAANNVQGCDLAYYNNSAAGSLLMAAESGETEPGRLQQAASYLSSASGHNSTNCPDHHSLQAFIFLNETLLAIIQKRAQLAEEKLMAIHQLSDRSDRVQTWVGDFAGRIALLKKRWDEAEMAFEKLKGQSRSKEDAEAMWRATLGLARVKLAIEQPDAALALLQENAQRTDQLAEAIGIHEERSRFYNLRKQNSQLLLETLIAIGDAEAVLAVLKHARQRVLGDALRQFAIENRSAQQHRGVQRYVDKRKQEAAAKANSWMLSQSEFQHQEKRQAAAKSQLVSEIAQVNAITELSTPREQNGPSTEENKKASFPANTLNLYFFRDGNGTVVVAENNRGPIMKHFDKSNGGAKKEVDVIKNLQFDTSQFESLAFLILPFAREIDEAEMINLYGSGEFATTALHRIPFRGKPLGEQKTLLYRLDLADTLPDFSWPHPGMLLVGDAHGDLPNSRKEIKALSKFSNELATTLTGEAVTYSALRSELPKHRHVHYSGHGDAKGQSWQSSLALANDNGLSIGDILTLDKVPYSLVLSACSTNHNAVQSMVEDWSTVNAFLVAGSAWVMGSPEPIDDQDAFVFMQKLYQFWKAEDDLLTAWQLTQRKLASLPTKNTWQHFRLYAK